MKPVTRKRRKGIIASKGIIITQSKYALIANIKQLTINKKLDANSLNAIKVPASLCYTMLFVLSQHDLFYVDPYPFKTSPYLIILLLNKPAPLVQ
jgi:hypothetical protein